jgi:hypothetical protein
MSKAREVYNALRWTPIYVGSFKDYEDTINSFRPYRWGSDDPEVPLVLEPAENEVIYAAYNIDGYEGSAILIFMKDGKLYEVNGSHCSCNGLEECWRPEETSWEALKIRQGWEGLGDVVAEWI